MFRIAAAFLITAGCYTLYAATIVPLIEPSAPPIRVRDPNPTTPTLVKQREMLANWFKPGDWEMGTPSVFETQQGKLLFDEYKPRDDGYIEICPCSMVFLSSEPNVDEADRIRRAVVLRAPAGALLRFDPPLKIGEAQNSRLVGGELLGEVQIHSGQRLPGPEDDLHVTTRDIVMTQTDVMTPHRLEFVLGGHHGSGVGMHVRLDTATTAGGATDLRGVQAFTLEQQAYFHLQPNEGGDFFPGRPGADEPPAAANPAAAGQARAKRPAVPVEVRSAGPFTFDFVANQALFRKDVDVQRLHLDGTRDTMTGDQLKIGFKPPPAAVAKPDPTQTAAVQKLDPERVEFLGEPVIIRAQANGLQARAQFVEHDVATREIHLRDATEVIVREGTRELRAPELFLQPSATGKFGSFRAVGRGRFDGASPEHPEQALHAQWSSHVHFRPHEDRHVLSVMGDARVEANTKGALVADEIHLWLKEVPKPAANNGPPAAEPEMELAPDRMLALGKVQIDSPQLVGAVERLEAWFEDVAPIGIAQKVGFRGELLAQAPAAEPAFEPLPPVDETAPPGPQPEPPIGVVPLPAPPPGAVPVQQFRIDGRILRLQVGVVAEQMQVREAIVEQNVRVVETKTASPDEKPLTIQGDVLHLVQTSPEESHTTVTGAPAFVEAREMTIAGGKLTLHRPNAETNRMAVEGQGVLTLPVDRDLQGNATPVPETLHLSWQGGMTFDGLSAEFDRGVEGRLTAQFLRTDRLKVTFDRPVGGGGPTGGGVPTGGPKPPGGDPRPQIAHVDCYGHVFLESRTNAPDGNLAAVERVDAGSLSLDQKSGDFTADGPGEVTSVRRGTALKPGAAGAAAQPPQPAAGPEAAESKINYLNVRFQRNVVGNLHRRAMTFHNQVKTLYGPVPDWAGVIDPNRPDKWLPQTVFVSCDQMQVSAHTDPNAGTDSYDLVAEGNTTTEGTNFLAKAPRLTYAQAKGLLVIEGDARTDAQLFQQDRVGGPRNNTSARRFMIWPSTNRVQIDGATFLELAPR